MEKRALVANFRVHPPREGRETNPREVHIPLHCPLKPVCYSDKGKIAYSSEASSLLYCDGFEWKAISPDFASQVEKDYSKMIPSKNVLSVDPKSNTGNNDYTNKH